MSVQAAGLRAGIAPALSWTWIDLVSKAKSPEFLPAGDVMSASDGEAAVCAAIVRDCHRLTDESERAYADAHALLGA
jgi:hypothetical protein